MVKLKIDNVKRNAWHTASAHWNLLLLEVAIEDYKGIIVTLVICNLPSLHFSFPAYRMGVLAVPTL